MIGVVYFANTTTQTIGHHFGFHGIRFLKPSYVSIVALLPRPEGIGDSLYRFISKIKKKRVHHFHSKDADISLRLMVYLSI